MWVSHHGQIVQVRSCECRCLLNNVVVESLVITLTIVACLAVTGQTLVSFDFMTVPKTTSVDKAHNVSDKENVTVNSPDVLQEDEHVLDILELVFSHTGLAIAGLFSLEILLKMISLRSIFFRNPWQILDAFVVLANAVVHLTFFFVSVSDPVHCACFVVIFRLWRIPFVCFMRANEVREQLDQDVELYRSGQRKAEERCIRLENELAQRKERVRKLEEILQSLAAENKIQMHTEVSKNKKLSPMMEKEGFNVKNNSLKENRHVKSRLSREGEHVLPNGKTPDRAIKTSNFEKERNVLIHHNNLLQKETSFTTEGNNLMKEKYAAMGIFAGTLPRSEALYDIKSLLTQSPTRLESVPYKQRRRRSSTSDFIDYSSLSSPDRNVSIQDEVRELSPSCSCPCLDISEEEGDTKLVSEDEQPSLDAVDGGITEHTKQPNAASRATSDASPASCSSASTSEQKDNQHTHKANKRIKRFPSCPEYVYTQRMSLTNDESLLIKDDLEYSGYDNSAFIEEDETQLQILAEIDGTKTYRSEDGIPMTSL